jgi:hypothetical protein
MSRSNKAKEVDRAPQYAHEECDEEELDSDDWNSVNDPQKRRQIQNRLAQRRYRKSSSLFHVHCLYALLLFNFLVTLLSL